MKSDRKKKKKNKMLKSIWAVKYSQTFASNE